MGRADCLPLVLLCASLVVLASAERRVWEADSNNNSGALLLKNGEAGKVVNFFTELDRVREPRILRLSPALDQQLQTLPQAVVPLRTAARFEPRAPPR